MRYRLEYILLVSIAAIFRILPRSAALSLGRKLGTLGLLLQPNRALIAEDNLRHAFPGMQKAERKKIIKQVFTNLGVGLVEMLRLDLFDGKKDLEKYFTIEGEEHIYEALASGKGCILLTGHLGFWEAGSFVFPVLGLPTAIVAKPMKNPLVDGYFRRLRESYGGYVIDSRKGARRIFKALQNNHLVGILMDQHTARNQAVRVPFFGRPAYTTPVIAQLAMKFQVPVVPVFAYRDSRNTYQVRVSPPLVLETDLSEKGILTGTTLLTTMIEEGIQHDIGQWFWVHRRWKYMNNNVK
jgi:KDO2-lipid IV(A) lauroyltransferase